jgi:hypothetical protein
MTQPRLITEGRKCQARNSRREITATPLRIMGNISLLVHNFESKARPPPTPPTSSTPTSCSKPALFAHSVVLRCEEAVGSLFGPLSNPYRIGHRWWLFYEARRWGGGILVNTLRLLRQITLYVFQRTRNSKKANLVKSGSCCDCSSRPSLHYRPYDIPLPPKTRTIPNLWPKTNNQ